MNKHDQSTIETIELVTSSATNSTTAWTTEDDASFRESKRQSSWRQGRRGAGEEWPNRARELRMYNYVREAVSREVGKLLQSLLND